MTTLENLWYGNLHPVEEFLADNKEYKGLLRLVSKNREKLEATLTPEQIRYNKLRKFKRGKNRHSLQTLVE